MYNNDDNNNNKNNNNNNNWNGIVVARVVARDDVSTQISILVV